MLCFIDNIDIVTYVRLKIVVGFFQICIYIFVAKYFYGIVYFFALQNAVVGLRNIL